MSRDRVFKRFVGWSIFITLIAVAHSFMPEGESWRRATATFFILLASHFPKAITGTDL